MESEKDKAERKRVEHEISKETHRHEVDHIVAAMSPEMRPAPSIFLKCPKCGYEWRTKSKNMFVSCPSCLSKVKVKQ